MTTFPCFVAVSCQTTIFRFWGFRFFLQQIRTENKSFLKKKKIGIVFVIDLYMVYRVIKRQFQGLQIGILNHPVTIKITELWAVTIKTVKIKQLSFNSK